MKVRVISACAAMPRGCQFLVGVNLMPFHSCFMDHNNTWMKPSAAKWRVRKALERNRSLLRTLREAGLRAEEAPNDWLVRRGFDVNFHTHLETTGEGKLVVMCFDEGYTIEQGEIRPCPNVSTALSS